LLIVLDGTLFLGFIAREVILNLSSPPPAVHQGLLLLDMNDENSIPSWYSQVQLFLVALVCFLLALAAGVATSGFLVVAFKRFIAPKELAEAEANLAVAAVPA
jgi:hypothetical protein